MKKLILALAMFMLPVTANAFPDDYEVRDIYGGEVVLTSVATPSVIDFGAQSSWVNVCAQTATGNSVFLRARTMASSQDFTEVSSVANFKSTSFTLAPLTATGGEGCSGWFPLWTRTVQVLTNGQPATVDFMVLPRR